MRKAACAGVLALLLLAPPASAAGADPAKEADIRRLLELTVRPEASLEPLRVLMGRLAPLAARRGPRCEERFRKELDEMFRDLETTYRESAVSLYDEAFSADEVREMVRFFESPAGRAYVERQPGILREVQGTALGGGQDLRKRLQELLRSEECRGRGEGAPDNTDRP